MVTLVRYGKMYDGRPCGNCGGTLRYLTGKGCVLCSDRRNNKNNPENRTLDKHETIIRGIVRRCESW